MTTPKTEGFYQPAEWTPHQACWLAWPSDESLWKEDLPATQKEFVALCKAIADIDVTTGKARGELLKILVANPKAKELAENALKGIPAEFYPIPYGDIWLRDTGPIFLVRQDGTLGSAQFLFNGWGEKYLLPHDAEVSAEISKTTDFRTFELPFILEGGSVDVDGEGTCLTTRQCLLNLNRKSKPKKAPEERTEDGPERIDPARIETHLCEALGISKVLWINEGLLNDHTDGHIDTLARFVAPGKVVCMQATDPAEDPNHPVLEEIASDLSKFKDAKGRSLEVIRIPSPGKVLSKEGRILPASYVNFYIGNSTVVVPTYGVPNDAVAVDAIAQLFPGRSTVGCSALSILTGGGAFHCITQQQPGGTYEV